MRGDGDGNGDGKTTRTSRPAAERAAPKRVSAEHAGGAAPAMTPVVSDADPVGPLRLEGQVLGPGDEPVGGATVTLSSVPPRTARSEADGSFAFDRLVGRAYAINARAGDLVGGPVLVTLSDRSDPVVVRLGAAAAVEVTVVGSDAGAPIAGAEVAAAGDDAGTVAPATTADDGRARLAGISPGDTVTISARAAGHAPGKQLVLVPDAPGQVVRARIALRRGAPVSGVVVDDAGSPVSGARVSARDMSEPFDLPDASDEAVTDRRGRFTLDAVAAGTYRFTASHAMFAPGSSEPRTVDGSAATSDVRVVLERGGVLAGRVVDAAGAPAPWATVRAGAQVGSLQGGLAEAPTRQVIAGEDGSFRLQGLPRSALSALAVTDAASSAAVAVDLVTRQEVLDLTLRLDISGRIAGVVVDGAGEAIAEAQVTAFPDFFGGGPLDDFALRGPASATTDGAGRFALVGLRDGSHRLSAGRAGMSNPFDGRGVSARTGNTSVRIVVEEDGSVKGRVTFADGGSPALFTVSIGYGTGLPVADPEGRFALPRVPPGNHDVTVRGPELVETVMRGVVVEAGKVRDVGAVTVSRGRQVSGRVLTASGAAVAGATVVLGAQILGDGSSLASATTAPFDEMMGVRRATSDGDGRYVLRGVGSDKELMLAAEHTSHGRSATAVVPPGSASRTIDLRLAGVGGVAGRVRAGGKPAAGAQVIATASGASKQNTLVTTGDDGTYQIDRLAVGTYQLSAMIGAGMGSTMGSKQVTIVAGKRAQADIDIAVGDITLTVTIVASSGTIDLSQVFLFDGTVTARNGKELTDAFLAASSQGGAKMVFAPAGQPAVFKEVAPGTKSVCVIPITGDMNDPVFAQRLQSQVDKLAVHCSETAVKPSPPQQSYTATVPPMAPLD